MTADSEPAEKGLVTGSAGHGVHVSDDESNDPGWWKMASPRTHGKGIVLSPKQSSAETANSESQLPQPTVQMAVRGMSRQVVSWRNHHRRQLVVAFKLLTRLQ